MKTTHTPAELARFADYMHQRAAACPLRCHHGTAPCWVRDGPPAMTTGGCCSGCGDTPSFDRIDPANKTLERRR